MHSSIRHAAAIAAIAVVFVPPVGAQTRNPFPTPPPVPPVPWPQPEARKWTCTGPVENCTGCNGKKPGEGDCSFTGRCASVTGRGRTEDKARRDALDECQAELDNSAPGLWWECKDSSKLTCEEK